VLRRFGDAQIVVQQASWETGTDDRRDLFSLVIRNRKMECRDECGHVFVKLKKESGKSGDKGT
jgi:hypothetical protein